MLSHWVVMVMNGNVLFRFQQCKCSLMLKQCVCPNTDLGVLEQTKSSQTTVRQSQVASWKAATLHGINT